MDYAKVLREYFGYDSFRSIQEDIIRSIGSGRDTLGLMPTGGGKSITFQVPALAQAGTCIVITPLIALMKDQVSKLRERGIKAAAIYSGMSRDSIVAALDNCILGDYKFLYVSPERLASDIFITKLRRIQVSFITVDESHCISQWGYDFRPSYLAIADIRKQLPEVPILALTATATPKGNAEFHSWREGGVVVSRDAAYTFTVGNRNMSLKAYFTPNTETTDGLGIAEAPASQGVVYDLMGRRVDNPTKGLYIVDGRKRIIR